MGSKKENQHPLGWSPGRRCPWHWEFWLWLASEHISSQHAQPTASPMADNELDLYLW